jgi:pilus assembly protein CpaB
MRRGGPILLVLVLIIVVLIAVAFLVVSGIIQIPGAPGSAASPTVPITEVVVVGQPINQNDEITAASLSTIKLPKNFVTEKMITDPQLVIGKFAKTPLSQGLPISLDMVTDRPNAGSSKVILPGQVAMSVPINEFTSLGYAIKDGDYVDVIATTLFVDLDASFQTVLPNSFGQIVNIGSQPDAAPLAVLGMNNGAGLQRAAGRAELDPTLNQVIYFIPSEQQRPRPVSQMILQDIQVLHVGLFSLTSGGDAQATPDASSATTPVPEVKPTMLTLIVSPQDAVSLTYFLNIGSKLSFVLRAPDDRSRAETEAATLQYLLSQYAIPVPAKLPYGIGPRLDQFPVIGGAPTPTPRP